MMLLRQRAAPDGATAAKRGHPSPSAAPARRAPPRAAAAAALPPAVADPALPAASGLRFLPEAARERAQDKKANKFEKVKVEKCGSTAWEEVHELSRLLREGETTWEALDLDDVDIRLKWAGLFHRGKRTPKRFMMRLKIPNGEVTSDQLRLLSDALTPYGADGCADITTRASLQLRGLTLEDSGPLIERMRAAGLACYQSGMDSVRNLTGSPIAGLDPHEQLDVRPLIRSLNAALHGARGEGVAEFANLPRKLNVCVSPSRDDFPHCHINDVGFEATSARCPETGQVLFDVVVGGYFSIKRNVVSVPLGASVREDELVDFVTAVLRAFRDHGGRTDRQKARLMWLVESMGVDAFRETVAGYLGVGALRPAVGGGHAAHGAAAASDGGNGNGDGSSSSSDQPDVWVRRDILGVHEQKQPGMRWVGACVPAGRLSAQEMRGLADAAERHGDGTLRLTCEENVVIPNVPASSVDALLAEPVFSAPGSRISVFPGRLMRGMVSCTGAQFCGLALIETKNRAMDIVAKLESQLELPRTVRVHWTGCPNSCGQAQVADVGLMGAPARHEGKAVEGVRIFVGGTVGEGASLAAELEAGVPCVESVLLPKLRAIMVERFGARVKEGAVLEEAAAAAAPAVAAA